jgi:tetratricopeptide (TPR) repeat protein
MPSAGKLLSGFFLGLVLISATGLAQEEPEEISSQPPPPEVLLQQADSALQSEDFAAASAALEAYLAQVPEDFRAKFNLALAFSMTGRQGDAIRLYREVLAQQADLVPPRVNLGILLLQQGNAAEALEEFRLVLADQSDHWAAQVNLAGALVALDRAPEAADAYQRALELRPDDAPTHLAYGKVLASLDAPDAERQLRRAMELDPSQEEAKLVLAGVLAERAAQDADTLTEAISLHQELLATHPDHIDLRIRLADLYLSQKRIAEAVQELETARGAIPNDALLNRALLDLYLEAKENKKAQILLPGVLTQNPGDPSLHMLQGSLFMEERKYPDAAAAFRRAVELDPQEIEGFTNLASALYLMKDYEGTILALENVAALGKDTAGSYFVRAISLDKLGLKEPAYDNYQRFLETSEQKHPDQEFQARQRLIVLERELKSSRGR